MQPAPKPQHTPGRHNTKWQVLPVYMGSNKYPIAYRCDDESGEAYRIFAEVLGDGGTPENDRKTADLIAAAPELLEALLTLLPHVMHYAPMPHAHSDTYRDIAKARQVLAKATGKWE